MALFGNAKLGKEQLRNEGIKGEIASAERLFLLLKAQKLCYIRDVIKCIETILRKKSS